MIVVNSVFRMTTVSQARDQREYCYGRPLLLYLLGDAKYA